MIDYAGWVEKLEKKVGVGAMSGHLLKMSDMPTFTQKVEYMQKVHAGKVPLTDDGLKAWQDEDIL